MGFNCLRIQKEWRYSSYYLLRLSHIICKTNNYNEFYNRFPIWSWRRLWSTPGGWLIAGRGKASIISSKNGSWEVKVGIVFPLTLIDDSDFPVYDIYDINQYWIRILGFYLTIWGYCRANHVHGRFLMSEVTVTRKRPIGWFLNVFIEKIQSEWVFSGSKWIWYYANHP